MKDDGTHVMWEKNYLNYNQMLKMFNLYLFDLKETESNHIIHGRLEECEQLHLKKSHSSSETFLLKKYQELACQDKAIKMTSHIYDKYLEFHHSRDGG